MSIISKILQDSYVLEYIAIRLFRLSRGNLRAFFYLVCLISAILSSIITDVILVIILVPIVLEINFEEFFALNIKEKERRDRCDTSPEDLKNRVMGKKVFNINLAGLIVMIILFAIFPLQAHVISLISATLLIIISQRFSHKKMGEILLNMDWEILFFLIGLFIIIGCLIEAGFLEIINIIPFRKFNPLLLDLSLLTVISLLSGAIANTPITLVFILIIDTLIVDYGIDSNHILFTFIVGINLASNFVPQGAVSDMVILKISRENEVENLSYWRLFKFGGAFAIIHALLSVIWIIVLILT